MSAMDIPTGPEEFYTEPVVGWRVWYSRDGGLQGIGTSHHWIVGRENKAGCAHYKQVGDGWVRVKRLSSGMVLESADPVEHVVPNPDCGCGFWALKSREDAEEVLNSYERFTDSACVLGRVSLWGKVVCGKRGYRGEFAYPYELFVFDGNEELAAGLRDQWKVDVQVLPGRPPDRREDMLREMDAQLRRARLWLLLWTLPLFLSMIALTALTFTTKNHWYSRIQLAVAAAIWLPTMWRKLRASRR